MWIKNVQKFFILRYFKERKEIMNMKKLIVTFIISLIMVTTMTNSTQLPFRHGIQLPYLMLKNINDAAISVNSMNYNLDIVLNEQFIGKITRLEGTTIYAFKNDKFKVLDKIIELVDNIKSSAGENEIILTGYGKGANLAAKVAENLSQYMPRSNQVKLFAFCADQKITESLSKISILSKLHFSRQCNLQCIKSNMIEFPQSICKSISSRFSLIGSAIGASIGAACCFAIGQFDDIPNVLEVLPIAFATVLAFSRSPQQYFSIDEIWNRYELAKSRLMYATPDEYKTLGM